MKLPVVATIAQGVLAVRDSIFYDKTSPLFLALLLLLTLSMACQPESETTRVDFTKTIPETAPVMQTASSAPLKFAIAAMISPRATAVHYRELVDYVSHQLNRPVELVQRKTYSEINQLLGQGRIDLAFICSGPYFTGEEQQGFEAIAIPQVRGSTLYQSYLIVNQGSPFATLGDLRGRVFAFSDPDSLTGKLVPTRWLAQIGETPETFFSEVIYTYSHDNSILAVAKGLVDGAAVDSLVWDYLRERDPTWTSSTRIIKKSEAYGIPPIVVSKSVAQDVRQGVEKIIFSMHDEPNGKKILQGLMIDRFSPPDEEWRQTIRRIGDGAIDSPRQSNAVQDAQN